MLDVTWLASFENDVAQTVRYSVIGYHWSQYATYYEQNQLRHLQR